MKVFEGVSGAWNYTIGPAFIYEGPSSIGEINLRSMPTVVVTEYIPLTELAKIDLNHVHGFVLQGGGLGDSSRVFYSNQHRATVLRCEGILEAVRPDEIVVVDGVNAKVFLEPDAETLAKYEDLRLKGPPPEPEGFTDQLIKDAMELATLDGQSLKDGFIDFDKLTQAMGTFMQMYRSEALSDKDVANLQEMVKGSDVEESVAKNLAKYQDAAKNMSEEERKERQLRAPLE
ncbi:hypothetical protein ACFL59_05155 [Planctomycetota bacterium]